MKRLIRSPWQCPLYLPSQGPRNRREPGPFICLWHPVLLILFGHASIVSCLQARSRLFVTKRNFFIVESVENGKKCRCHGGLRMGRQTPTYSGPNPTTGQKHFGLLAYYALGCCRLIELFKISVVIFNTEDDSLDFAKPNREKGSYQAAENFDFDLLVRRRLGYQAHLWWPATAASSAA
jgi:hypothetical protein